MVTTSISPESTASILQTDYFKTLVPICQTTWHPVAE